MELQDLAPWIAIAFTLALSILVPLFTQIANNRHQRKMQRDKFEYEERQKRTNAFEAFLSDLGNAVVCRNMENLGKAGSGIYRMYVFASPEWLNDLDSLAQAMVMKTRMLLNPEMRANGFVTKLVVVTSQTQNIEDFGVDINDLMKMQEQYHQLIADTCGIQFKKSKWPEELKAIAESCGE